MSKRKTMLSAHPRKMKECGHCRQMKDIDTRCTYCSVECTRAALSEKTRLGLINKARAIGAVPFATATSSQLKRLIKKAQVEVRREEKEADKAVTGALFIAETLEQAQTAKPPIWTYSKRSKLAKKQNYVVAMLSDTHFDEKVYPEQIQGINAYGRDIGDLRLKEFFHNIVELSDDWLSGIKYDGLILPLGGDIFTGYIHEELRENLDAPIFDSLFHYGDLLISGIKMLRDYFGTVKIPAVVGNHGRLDRKPRSKFRAHDSYDWALYQYIKHHFEVTNTKGIEFMISDSADQMFSVYDTSFCLTHGDQFRGGAGISGIHCVTPDTPILLEDLSYVEAGDIKEGTRLIGFDDDDKVEQGQRRRFRPSRVTGVERKTLECMEIETSDGIKTICSLDHPWLTRSGIAHSWSLTENLHLGSRIISFGKPWQRQNDWDTGYLAGVLDGEGNVEKKLGRISFAQRKNECLREVKRILNERGIKFTQRQNSASDVQNIRLFTGDRQKNKNTANRIRLLAEVQPKRLLAKADYIWKNRSIQIAKESIVVGLRYVGNQEVAAFKTSTGTYIANGMLTHNTPLAIGDYRKRRRLGKMKQSYEWLLMGHWHQLMFTNGIIVNGSLIGYSEYGFTKNLDYDSPKQAFFLVDPEHGITIRAPIHVSTKAEVWKAADGKVWAHAAR